MIHKKYVKKGSILYMDPITRKLSNSQSNDYTESVVLINEQGSVKTFMEDGYDLLGVQSWECLVSGVSIEDLTIEFLIGKHSYYYKKHSTDWEKEHVDEDSSPTINTGYTEDPYEIIINDKVYKWFNNGG
jgi:hypothetical protein